MRWSWSRNLKVTMDCCVIVDFVARMLVVRISIRRNGKSGAPDSQSGIPDISFFAAEALSPMHPCTIRPPWRI